MRTDREKFVAGFSVKDSMRERAKRELGHEFKGENMSPKKGKLSEGTEGTRLYKKGGEARVKKNFGGLMNTMANATMNPVGTALNAATGRKPPIGIFKKGGSARVKKNFGGAIPDWAKSAVGSNVLKPGDFKMVKEAFMPGSTVQHRQPITQMSGPGPSTNTMPTAANPTGQNPVFKRGGKMSKSKKHCYADGGDVYEREMVGERPSRSRPHINYEANMKGEHGRRSTYAAGGVGKIRHKQATKSGSPMGSRRVTRGPYAD